MKLHSKVRDKRSKSVLLNDNFCKYSWNSYIFFMMKNKLPICSLTFLNMYFISIYNLLLIFIFIPFILVFLNLIKLSIYYFKTFKTLFLDLQLIFISSEHFSNFKVFNLEFNLVGLFFLNFISIFTQLHLKILFLLFNLWVINFNLFWCLSKGFIFFLLIKFHNSKLIVYFFVVRIPFKWCMTFRYFSFFFTVLNKQNYYNKVEYYMNK